MFQTRSDKSQRPFIAFTGALILFTSLLLLSGGAALGQQDKANLYSGGMLFLQPGYTFTTNIHQEIRDHSFGLGGILRFYLPHHLTAGIYGGTQKTGYVSANSVNSTMNLGYGGPFIGYSRLSGRFRYTLSAFAGKGTLRNLHIESQQGNSLSESYLYSHGVWVFSPLLSLDYALTKRLLFTFQGVCLTTKYNTGMLFYNPTAQLGILFNR
jgi:hypothetical protein